MFDKFATFVKVPWGTFSATVQPNKPKKRYRMMKRYMLLPVLLLLSLALEAQPIDITVGGGLDALSIYTKNLDAEYDLKSRDFAPIPFWFAKIGGEIGKKFRFDLEYRQDPFWLSTVSGSVGAIYKLLNLGIGAQFGFHEYDSGDFSLDKIESWDSGLITYIRLVSPGAYYAGFDYLLDLKSSYGGYGKSERHYLAVKAGFWLPHILIQASWSRKEYAESKTAQLDFNAGQEKLDVNMEFFSKNIPFRLSLGAGSIKLNTDANSSVTGRVNQDASYWYASTGLTFIFGNHFQFFVKGELPFEELHPQLQKISATAGIVLTILDDDSR
jgi:hypothetical protein